MLPQGFPVSTMVVLAISKSDQVRRACSVFPLRIHTPTRSQPQIVVGDVFVVYEVPDSCGMDSGLSGSNSMKYFLLRLARFPSAHRGTYWIIKRCHETYNTADDNIQPQMLTPIMICALLVLLNNIPSSYSTVAWTRHVLSLSPRRPTTDSNASLSRRTAPLGPYAKYHGQIPECLDVRDP